MKLTEHFSLDELTFSQTAVRKSIDNTPPPPVVSNLKRIAAMLELVRALTGSPISVSSGYRCPALNKAIGGASNSMHVLGLAADITCPGMNPRELATVIRDSDLTFDQLIYEGTWVHIGLSPGLARGQVLTALFGAAGTKYVNGIQ